MSTAYLKLPSTVGNTAMTVPPSWSSAALSTFSPIANFDIENSQWNHRCDYISTNQLTLLNYLSESEFRNSDGGCCYNVSVFAFGMQFPRGTHRPIPLLTVGSWVARMAIAVLTGDSLGR